MPYVAGGRKYYIPQPGDDPTKALTEEKADKAIAAYKASLPSPPNPRKMIQDLRTNPEVKVWLSSLDDVSRGVLLSAATAAGLSGEFTELEEVLAEINDASGLPANVVSAIATAATNNAVSISLPGA